MNTTIEFYILQLVYVPNFSLNWQYWFFGPNLSKKGYFRSKTEKLDISRDTTCQLKLTILIFLRPNLPKKGCFRSKSRIEHHHWILYIQISLSTKFQFKLTILIFWTKLVQKRYFWLKTQKVDITMGFQLKLTILSFWTKFAQKIFSRKQKNCTFACVCDRYLLHAVY